MKVIDSIRRILDPLSWAKKNGMQCGKGVTLASKQGTSFGSEPYLIKIADNVRLSGGVKFFTHDGGTWAFRDIEKYQKVFKYGRIEIGERSFIGYGVIILPGVIIGKRCVIGAGSIVTHSIPDDSVACGNPARVVCSTEEYAEKCYLRFINENHNIDEYKKDKRTYLTKKYVNRSKGEVDD